MEMSIDPERLGRESLHYRGRYPCPECTERFDFPELLGRHLERHREVMPEQRNRNKRLITEPCPNGCGRNFYRCKDGGKTREWHEHMRVCDGSQPLPVVQSKSQGVANALVNLFVRREPRPAPLGAGVGDPDPRRDQAVPAGADPGVGVLGGGGAEAPGSAPAA